MEKNHIRRFGQRGPHRRNDPGRLRLWPIGWALAACCAAAGIALAGLTWVAWALLRKPKLPHSSTISLHDAIGVLQLVFASVAGAGALVALVVAYRRQKVAETEAAHDRTRVLNERFTTIAAQLGDDQAAVRLAGVHAMAGLADDWEENRQTCIDVLCAYLRMPYEPEPGDEAPSAERLAFRGIREVRHTVIRVIAAHLGLEAVVSWQGLNFDFTGVTLDGGDFSGARFSGGEVNFSGARFSGSEVNFSGAAFSGSWVNFRGAVFSAGEVNFSGAAFSGGEVNFSCARFSGGTVRFNRAAFSGGEVSFNWRRVLRRHGQIQPRRVLRRLRSISSAPGSPAARSASAAPGSPAARSDSTGPRSPAPRSDSTTPRSPAAKLTSAVQLTGLIRRRSTGKARHPPRSSCRQLDLDTAMDKVADRVLEARRKGWQDTDKEGNTLRRTMGIASLGGATVDNEENSVSASGDPGAGRYRAAGQALRCLRGAVRCGASAAASATALPGQPQGPCPSQVRTSGGHESPGTHSPPSSSGEPSPTQQYQAPTGADQCARDALSGTRRASQGVDQNMSHLRLLQRLQRRHHCR